MTPPYCRAVKSFGCGSMRDDEFGSIFCWGVGLMLGPVIFGTGSTASFGTQRLRSTRERNWSSDIGTAWAEAEAVPEPDGLYTNVKKVQYYQKLRHAVHNNQTYTQKLLTRRRQNRMTTQMKMIHHRRRWSHPMSHRQIETAAAPCRMRWSRMKAMVWPRIQLAPLVWAAGQA